MELLAIIILAIWAMGIAIGALSLIYTLKHDTNDKTLEVKAALDREPAIMTALMAVIVVFWPATVVYSLATRKK